MDVVASIPFNYSSFHSIIDVLFMIGVVTAGIVIAVMIIAALDELMYENRETLYLGGFLTACFALLGFLHFHHH